MSLSAFLKNIMNPLENDISEEILKPSSYSSSEDEDQIQSSSPYLSAYRKFIGSFQSPSQHLLLARLASASIRFTPVPQIYSFFVYSQVNTPLYDIVTYSVSFGYFSTSVTILNLPEKSPFHEHYFDQGSYGKLYQMHHQNQLLALKCFEIKHHSFRFKNILHEYSILKLCSALECAPQIQQLGFDIICYEQCMEFCMEKCSKPVQTSTQPLDLSLKKILKILHTLNIVHLDIKPANVLFSPHLQKNVLVDFGLSRVLEESLGEMSLTMFRGTFTYSSDQMQRIFTTKTPKSIDLYYNDAECLRKSFKELLEIQGSSQSFLEDSKDPNINALLYNLRFALHFNKTETAQQLFEKHKQLFFHYRSEILDFMTLMATTDVSEFYRKNFGDDKSQMSLFNPRKAKRLTETDLAMLANFQKRLCLVQPAVAIVQPYRNLLKENYTIQDLHIFLEGVRILNSENPPRAIQNNLSVFGLTNKTQLARFILNNALPRLRRVEPFTFSTVNLMTDLLLQVILYDCADLGNIIEGFEEICRQETQNDLKIHILYRLSLLQFFLDAKVHSDYIFNAMVSREYLRVNICNVVGTSKMSRIILRLLRIQFRIDPPPPSGYSIQFQIVHFHNFHEGISKQELVQFCAHVMKRLPCPPLLPLFSPLNGWEYFHFRLCEVYLQANDTESIQMLLRLFRKSLPYPHLSRKFMVYHFDNQNVPQLIDSVRFDQVEPSMLINRFVPLLLTEIQKDTISLNNTLNLKHQAPVKRIRDLFICFLRKQVSFHICKGLQVANFIFLIDLAHGRPQSQQIWAFYVRQQTQMAVPCQKCLLLIPYTQKFIFALLSYNQGKLHAARDQLIELLPYQQIFSKEVFLQILLLLHFSRSAEALPILIRQTIYFTHRRYIFMPMLLNVHSTIYNFLLRKRQINLLCFLILKITLELGASISSLNVDRVRKSFRAFTQIQVQNYEQEDEVILQRKKECCLKIVERIFEVEQDVNKIVLSELEELGMEKKQAVSFQRKQPCNAYISLFYLQILDFSSSESEILRRIGVKIDYLSPYAKSVVLPKYYAHLNRIYRTKNIARLYRKHTAPPLESQQASLLVHRKEIADCFRKKISRYLSLQGSSREKVIIGNSAPGVPAGILPCIS